MLVSAVEGQSPVRIHPLDFPKICRSKSSGVSRSIDEAPYLPTSSNASSAEFLVVRPGRLRRLEPNSFELEISSIDDLHGQDATQRKFFGGRSTR